MPAIADRHEDGGIPGWCFPEQLAWLRVQARTHARILELGAWKGRITAALAEETPGKVWAVDRFYSDDPDDEVTLGTETPEQLFMAWRSNVAHVARKVELLPMESHEARRRLGHLCFDMVWLDADHRYEPVRQHIRDWRSLLVPGGLLCGHDAERPFVRRAVDELVPGAQFHATRQPAPYEHRPSLIWWAVV